MWKPSLNRITGPDAQALREILQDLQRFLEEPTFEKGIHLGDGVAVYNPTTGKAGRVDTSLVRRQIVQDIGMSTDASGYAVFNHGAPAQPQAVLVQATAPSQSPAVWCTTVDQVGPTTARARFFEFTGGAMAIRASGLVSFTAITIL